MEFERIIKIETKRLLSGVKYREIREDLLERFYPKEALHIATSSYKSFKKERIKSLAKAVGIKLLLLCAIYFTAPPSHQLKAKISLIIMTLMVLRVGYDWYMIKKADREFSLS
jgi:hypothetical protein